jgi:hypothetical protein
MALDLRHGHKPRDVGISWMACLGIGQINQALDSLIDFRPDQVLNFSGLVSSTCVDSAAEFRLSVQYPNMQHQRRLASVAQDLCF